MIDRMKNHIIVQIGNILLDTFSNVLPKYFENKTVQGLENN